MSLSHKDALKLLMPVELGDVFEDDITIEGSHLDDARDVVDALYLNVFPDTSEDLLADWERVLGITSSDSTSTADRQAACVAKLKARGGLSKPYFIQLAAAYDYEIEIVEYSPFMAGINAAGDTVYIDAIRWCWEVRVNSEDVAFEDGDVELEDGDVIFGEGNPISLDELEALFEDLKPAHTFVYFT